jgi:hypothetical protein
MKSRNWLFLFLIVLTLVRLAYGACNALSPDEAYYSMWSQRLDWSYFSKGPGIALVIRAGTALFGVNELGVRFFSPICGLGTSLLMFFLARRLYGESVGIWTVIAINAAPIFMVGGVVMTIDPVSIFFWTAALCTFWLALEQDQRAEAHVVHPNRWRFSLHWPLTGLLIGAGFLAKYTNAMQLLSLVLVLALSSKHRREFARPGFYVMLVAFLLCTTPVVIWNRQHEWITLFHLKARGGLNESTGFHPLMSLLEFGKFLVLHLGVYSPLLFLGFLVALVWAGKQARTHFKARFLLLFSLPLLVMYFLLAFKKAGEPNWTGPAFVSLAILATAYWHQKAKESLGSRRYAIAAIALGILMGLIVLNPEPLRAVGIPWPYDKDPGSRIRGWKTTAQKVEEIRHEFEKETGKPAFLIGNSYGTCASLAFYMNDKRVEGPNHPPVYIPESQNLENQFSFWPRYDEITDYRAIASDYLAKPGSEAEAASRKELAEALKDLPIDGTPEATGEKADAAWRRFLKALQAAIPSMPIVEYASEERGTNFFLGRNALYITDRGEERPPTSLKSGFERVEMIALFNVTRRNQSLRQVRVFACYGYRSVPL